MNEIKKIIKSSIDEVKEYGLRTYLSHVIEKIKNREFYIVDEFSSGKEFSKINEPSDDYERWITKNEPSIEQMIEEYKQIKLTKNPLISIVMSVYDPPLSIFQETINSVITQIYENWELCISNGSENEEITNELEKISREDKRIKVKHVINKGISANTNIALELSNGEFVALLDHDDTLSPNALFEIAKVVDKDESIDFIYSDADKITEFGKRYQPFFKPDWSPEILYSSNYVAHLCVFRKKVMDQIERFSSKKDGAQDWDMILRTIEISRKIHHIPKVLYHWRTLRNSTASSRSAKPFALNSQLMAVNRHLQEKNIQAYVIHGPGNYLKCNFYMQIPKISIIIPIIKIEKHLESYLMNKTKSDSKSDYEIILVVKKELKFDLKNKEYFIKNNVTWHKKQFEYISDALNFGASLAQGKLLLFLNLALEPNSPKWLEEMAGWCTIDKIGCVSCKITDIKGIIKHGGVTIDKEGYCHYVFNGLRDRSAVWTIFGAQEWYRNFNAVTGDCLMIRKELFLSNNGFENRDGFDIDFCLKLREKGYRMVYTPHSKLIIHGKLKNLKKIDVNNYRNIKLGDSYMSPHLEYHDVRKIKMGEN